tara:strand:- start:67 stop:369 length:303 start_codon:yes stop_codon:yes gene_type:complete
MGTRINVSKDKRIGGKHLVVNGRKVEWFVSDAVKVEQLSDAHWRITDHRGWEWGVFGGFHAGGTSQDWFLECPKGEGWNEACPVIDFKSATKAVRCIFNC